MSSQESNSLPGMRSWLLLIALSLLFASVTAIWVRLDQRPPSWDDAWYLTNSLVMFDALVDGGVFGYARRFLTILGFKAPLITILPTPFYLLLGRRWHAAYLVNLVAMLVLFAALYAIGKRLRNARAGVVAVYVSGTMPLLYGLSRWFLVEYSLTAIVAVAIALLMSPEGLEKTWRARLFGAVCGIGLLMKVSFPLYVALPFLYLLAVSKQRLRIIVWTAVPCAVVALPWYALNFGATLRTAWSAGYGPLAEMHGGAPFSFSVVSIYLSRVMNDGISPYYAGALVVLAILAAVRPRRPTREEWLLILWLASFLVLVSATGRDVKYLAPICPAIALALALGVERVFRETRLANGLLCVFLAYPLAVMVGTSFGLAFPGQQTGYARACDRQPWPQREILEKICSSTSFEAGKPKRLVVGTDRAPFNADNFHLFVVKDRLPVTVATTAYETSTVEAVRMVDGAAFFVYKEGGEAESQVFNRHQAEVVRHVREDGGFEELPYAKKVPDGGVVHIFRAKGNAGPR